MDSGTNQAFVMASVARFCSLWAAGMDAALKLESVRGQATLSLEARLGSPGGGPPPLFPGAPFPPNTPPYSWQPWTLSSGQPRTHPYPPPTHGNPGQRRTRPRGYPCPLHPPSPGHSGARHPRRWSKQGLPCHPLLPRGAATGHDTAAQPI